MEAPTKSETERLAEASGLSTEEVEAKLAAGLLFYRESDYFGGEQPPGEWLDATGTEVVVYGLGRGDFSFYWGRGADLAAAKAKFRREGGLLSKGYEILTFGPGSAFIGIGGMGYRYLGEKPEVTTVPAKGAKK